MLLWLSHLLLTPFNLSRVASDDMSDAVTSIELPLNLPAATPMIGQKLVHTAINYLARPGKEREAAKILLARLALRPDMQKIGLQDSIITWTLNEMDSVRESESRSIYGPMGRLAFLVAFAKSADDGAIAATFNIIWGSLQYLMADETAQNDGFLSLVIVRKLIVKLYRTIGTAVYRLRLEDWKPTLESILTHLCSALEDNDTSVRLAASKALGIITSQLDAEMIIQVFEAIWDTLDEDFNWDSTVTKLATPDPEYDRKTLVMAEADYKLVNVQRWHGNVFSIAHMIYFRALPDEVLFRCALIFVAALNFSQQLAVKTLGANVRDAACYGLWAIARKYRNPEFLDAIDRPEILGNSVLQSLARELTKAACLDLENNVRRAASAALQEMVGRYPDVIDHGIDLVRIVDYHAIALRSHAMMEVTLKASRLGSLYLTTMIEGLMGWRGIQHHDDAVRDLSAQSLGFVAAIS